MIYLIAIYSTSRKTACTFTKWGIGIDLILKWNYQPCLVYYSSSLFLRIALLKYGHTSIQCPLANIVYIFLP